MQDRKVFHSAGQSVSQRHDDGKDHGGGSDDGGADEHRFGRGLERVSCPVVFLQQLLGRLEVEIEPEVPLDILLDAGHLLDQGELVNGLGVVGHRAIAVHRDRDRAHAQKAERHQTEGEDGRGLHQIAQAERADPVGDGHQAHDGDAQPVGGEVARHESREDVERGTALSRRGDDFTHVPRLGRGKDLYQFGDDGAGQRAAADHGGELPPQIRVAAQVAGRSRRRAGR